MAILVIQSNRHDLFRAYVLHGGSLVRTLMSMLEYPVVTKIGVTVFSQEFCYDSDSPLSHCCMQKDCWTTDAPLDCTEEVTTAAERLFQEWKDLVESDIREKRSLNNRVDVLQHIRDFLTADNVVLKAQVVSFTTGVPSNSARHQVGQRKQRRELDSKRHDVANIDWHDADNAEGLNLSEMNKFSNKFYYISVKEARPRIKLLPE